VFAVVVCCFYRWGKQCVCAVGLARCGRHHREAPQHTVVVHHERLHAFLQVSGLLWWGAQGGATDATDATDATVWIRGEHWCTDNQHNTCLGHCLILVVLIHAFGV
jgi:hypothetical protein